ncbi:MAG TPA: hypothetical protein VFF06_16280, partial [Polyangia bacterium]|nr:hypothetical protein [Polyangia bacterium]
RRRFLVLVLRLLLFLFFVLRAGVGRAGEPEDTRERDEMTGVSHVRTSSARKVGAAPAPRFPVDEALATRATRGGEKIGCQFEERG